MEFAIRWGEMDAFAHLNNTVHFRYFESVRVAYSERVRIFDKARGFGPILADTRCRYRIPLAYPDTLAVGVRVTAVREYDVTQEYGVFSHAHDAVAALGEARIVCLNYTTGRKARIRKAVRDRIAVFESRHADGA
jgi:acyl-CoA thioester hydrolase